MADPISIDLDDALTTRGLTDVSKRGTRVASAGGLDPRNTLIVNTGDSTIQLLAQSGGFNTRMTQLTAVNGPAEGLFGWVNLGSSGYEMNQFSNDPLNVSWGGPVAGNADWNFTGAKQNAAATVSTPRANLNAFLAGLDPKIKPVVCIAHGPNDVGKNVSVGTLSQSDLETFYITRLRADVEAIHAARANTLIFIVIQQRILARPYSGTVPVTAVWNAPGAPGFGTDLVADTALLTKMNTALFNAKTQVAGEYGYTTLWDWQKEAMGYPAVDTDTPTTWPFYADNAHESAIAANALVDSLVRILFGNRLAPSKARIRLADRVANANTLTVEEQYPRYCEGRPDRYVEAFSGYLSASSAAFMDVGNLEANGNYTAFEAWTATVNGKKPIFVQVGDGICQKFTAYTAGAQGTNLVRFTGVVPNAAIQALTGTNMPVKIYIIREAGASEQLGVAAPLSAFTACSIVRRPMAGLTSFTFNTGIAVASTVAFTISKITGNAKTALASGTVNANAYVATVTFSWDAKAGDVVVVDVTAIGGTGPVYSGAAVISGLLS